MCCGLQQHSAVGLIRLAMVVFQTYRVASLYVAEPVGRDDFAVWPVLEMGEH